MKNLRKSIAAILVVSVIAVMVAIPAFAAISYLGTSVYWYDIFETRADATGTGTSTNGDKYNMYVSISSPSTGESQSTTVFGRSGTTFATTGIVNVTYPSPIPVISMSGRVYQ